jgi:hypothetical protein
VRIPSRTRKALGMVIWPFSETTVFIRILYEFLPRMSSQSGESPWHQLGYQQFPVPVIPPRARMAATDSDSATNEPARPGLLSTHKLGVAC